VKAVIKKAGPAKSKQKSSVSPDSPNATRVSGSAPETPDQAPTRSRSSKSNVIAKDVGVEDLIDSDDDAVKSSTKK